MMNFAAIWSGAAYVVFFAALLALLCAVLPFGFSTFAARGLLTAYITESSDGDGYIFLLLKPPGSGALCAFAHRIRELIFGPFSPGARYRSGARRG